MSGAICNHCECCFYTSIKTGIRSFPPQSTDFYQGHRETMSAKTDPTAVTEEASSARKDRRDLLLVPYVLLVALYMHTVQPLVQPLPPETINTALAKAAPIWYLAGYVGLCPGFEDNGLAQAARAGLVLSSLGDMCLVWRQTLFLPGMFFFALTQMAYICGLRSWMRRGGYPLDSRFGKELVLACSAGYLFVFTGIDSWFMAVCTLAYSALLVIMTYLSLQRHFAEENGASLCGALGACVFLVSDMLIAVTKWKFSFPFSELIIMVTYYAAQGAIATGVVYSARLERKE